MEGMKAWWHAGDPRVLFSFTSEATDMQNLACYCCKAAYWCMSTAVYFYVGQKVQSCQCRRHKAIRKTEKMQAAASACLWCALKQGALNITLILIMRFLFFCCYQLLFLVKAQHLMQTVFTVHVLFTYNIFHRKERHTANVQLYNYHKYICRLTFLNA